VSAGAARGDARTSSASEELPPPGDALRAAYDALPYHSLPFAQSHPDRLATAAKLFGASPAPIDACRVLEIGCASGGNLIPMAATLPHSRFVGVDLSPVQVAQGISDIAALRLPNIELVQADLRTFEGDDEHFDYIIAHGVLSWVPPEVQERVFEVCTRMLAPQGVAYISYNTLPGWQTRGAVRDAMRYHVRRFRDPATQVLQARALLDFLAESLQADQSAYATALRDEAARLRQQPDFYIFHDHLEAVNQPFYFHEFMERATRHGLRYLGEAEIKAMLTHDLAPNASAMLARLAPDLLQREQFLDFLRNQTFRQTLLVRQDVALHRSLSPDRLFGMHVATRATAHPSTDAAGKQGVEFRSAEGSALHTRRALTQAAMGVLIECSPEAIEFDVLCATAGKRIGIPEVPADERVALASDLLQAFAVGVVELRAIASPFTVEIGERPLGSAVARLQCQRGVQVANLRHEWVTLDDDQRRVLALLDGDRSQERVAAAAWSDSSAGPTKARVGATLTALARQALIAR